MPDGSLLMVQEAGERRAIRHLNVITNWLARPEDGHRLTELLPRDGLALPKLIEWALGIADALVACAPPGSGPSGSEARQHHGHRRRRIKVLDFGLAKLREGRHS